MLIVKVGAKVILFSHFSKFLRLFLANIKNYYVLCTVLFKKNYQP